MQPVQIPVAAEGREGGPFPPGSAFSWVTSFHLRLRKKGGRERTRPSARRRRPGAPAGCTRTSSPPPREQRQPGSFPPSTGQPQLLPVAGRSSAGTERPGARPVPPSHGNQQAAAATTCKKLRPAGLIPQLLAGPLPPIVTVRPASSQLASSAAAGPSHPRIPGSDCHGASFLPAPSHGPRQGTTAARPGLTEPT